MTVVVMLGGAPLTAAPRPFPSPPHHPADPSSLLPNPPCMHAVSLRRMSTSSSRTSAPPFNIVSFAPPPPCTVFQQVEVDNYITCLFSFP